MMNHEQAQNVLCAHSGSYQKALREDISRLALRVRTSNEGKLVCSLQEIAKAGFCEFIVDEKAGILVMRLYKRARNFYPGRYIVCVCVNDDACNKISKVTPLGLLM